MSELETLQEELKTVTAHLLETCTMLDNEWIDLPFPILLWRQKYEKQKQTMRDIATTKLQKEKQNPSENHVQRDG